MMPRLSPPTAMALPRRRESADCSTEAKKASASKWTMVRKGWSLARKGGLGWTKPGRELQET